MLQVSVTRIVLLIGGLAAVFLSFALQGGYATDLNGLPGPSTTAIVAIAGVAAIVISLVRGRRK